MSGSLIATLVVVGILLILIIFAVSAYNKFVKLRVGVDEGFATMDVYLKKRYDLIPNLVETVKGYAAHESETLEKVIAARNMAANATGMEDKFEGENMLSGTLKSLFAIAEAYPDLKANTNFMDLQRQLNAVEEDIANARKYYNALVREFNTAIQVFPSNIIANMFKFTARPMYEVNDSTERENVKVSFN